MLEAVNDEELQAKLKKLCDEQDAFQKQKDKEKAERSKGTGTSKKAGVKVKVENNMKVGANTKASGSTPKLEKQVRNWAKEDEEGDPADEEVFSQPEENLVQESNIVSSLMVEEPEDKEEAEKVCEDVEEVCEEIEEVCEEIEEVCKEIEGPHKEGKESHEVEDDETMKDLEGNEL
ncbi:hypothetical protein M422DRAFT_248411 [Sphaerobolus stellatus SS14]|uniref:Uncharacterized protein n=1 Tax=Sphaerobolus stellatus (strain SS14) TaxID=990650 RepID=A0A0C9UVY6_SPHS4|nr:hypothetical protein M422DRAFT_248411 [Sphaerobolus stellatus SS14]